jgi:hypothetical protein
MLKSSEAALSFVLSEAEQKDHRRTGDCSQSGNKGMHEKVRNARALRSESFFYERSIFRSIFQPLPPLPLPPPVFRP